MKQSNAVLLLESEEQVIRDVICSLRLIDVPVLASASVTEAKQSALNDKPCLILVRLRIQGDDAAGLALARDLAGDQDLRDVPVVLLCTASERRLVEEHTDLFDAQISLPVEFPLFTRQVQGILQRLSGEREHPRELKLLRSETVEKGEVRIDGNADVLYRNLGIISAIQHSVWENLRRDERVGKIPPEQMPGLVAEATREVCSKFNSKK